MMWQPFLFCFQLYNLPRSFWGKLELSSPLPLGSRHITASPVILETDIVQIGNLGGAVCVCVLSEQAVQNVSSYLNGLRNAS